MVHIGPQYTIGFYLPRFLYVRFHCIPTMKVLRSTEECRCSLNFLVFFSFLWFRCSLGRFLLSLQVVYLKVRVLRSTMLEGENEEELALCVAGSISNARC